MRVMRQTVEAALASKSLPKVAGHSSKARLLVTMTEPCS